MLFTYLRKKSKKVIRNTPSVWKRRHPNNAKIMGKLLHCRLIEIYETKLSFDSVHKT